MTLPALIAVPPGYRLLTPKDLTQIGDLQLGVDYPSIKTPGEVGAWEPLDPIDIGWRIGIEEGPIIRPTATTLKRARQAANRAARDPIASLIMALTHRDYKREGKTSYAHQEHRGDRTTYTILPDGRVKVLVSCWNPGDGWSDETVTARKALDRLTQRT